MQGFLFYNLGFLVYYPISIHGCTGIVFTLTGQACWREVAATSSGLNLFDPKLEEVQTRHTCSYHGLVVQHHGQTWIHPDLEHKNSS